jgi:hypothetical protein
MGVLATWVPLALKAKAGLIEARPVKSKECFFCASKKHCPLQVKRRV